MRISVEIEESQLKELLRLTGESKMSPAVSKVVSEFINRKKAREFGRLLREGAFDYGATNGEVEAQDR
jgi:hypothetical protein